APLAGLARPLDGEEARRLPHRTAALAGRAGFGGGARLRALALAHVARDGCRHADLRHLAGMCLGQADLHVVAEVRPALRSPAAAASTGAASSAHELSEEILEDVGHRRGELGPESAGERSLPAAHSALERLVSEAVVGRPFLGV